MGFWYYDEEQTLQIYYDVAAKYIRTIRHSPYIDNWSIVLGGPSILYNSWETILGDHYRSHNIVKAFKAEKREDSPDEDLLHQMRLVKCRMDRGWWDDDA